MNMTQSIGMILLIITWVYINSPNIHMVPEGTAIGAIMLFFLGILMILIGAGNSR